MGSETHLILCGEILISLMRIGVSLYRRYIMRKRRNKNFQDISGQKFNMLTVISLVGYSGNNSMWKCICDCGNEKIAGRHSLKHNITKSCGCLYKGKNSYNWKGCGDISSKYINSIRARAKKLKIEYNLDIKYLWDLYLQQNKKCAISGVDIVFSETYRSWQDKTASLDRIDSSQGYIIGNVQWLHKDINLMKLDHTQNEFINWCRVVANYQSIMRKDLD